MSKTKIRKLLKKNLSKIKKARIMCIGDMILDQYIYGNVERISPEAPIPILLVNDEKLELGGVGNVARNIVSMGANVTLISLSGKDRGSQQVNSLLLKEKKIKNASITHTDFYAPIKTRYINNSAHMVRIDKENKNFKINKIVRQKILKVIKKNINDCDIIILSDYNKGMLDIVTLKEIIKISKTCKKTIFVDPKKNDLEAYAGANLITPNLNELKNYSLKQLVTERDIINCCSNLINEHFFEEVLLTRSEKGLTLINRNLSKNFSSVAKKVYDVTGAGDTIIAIMALMKAIGLNTIDSALISNYAAGIVVSKSGTAVTNIREITT